MLCCLAFGEHEAPKRDLKRVGIAIPAEGKPTIPLRLYPTDSRDVITPPPRPFGRSKMFSWLAFGEHEALKRDMKRARILILAQGIPTSTARLFPTESRDTTLRRPSMGGSNALLASIWRP